MNQKILNRYNEKLKIKRAWMHSSSFFMWCIYKHMITGDLMKLYRIYLAIIGAGIFAAVDASDRIFIQQPVEFKPLAQVYVVEYFVEILSDGRTKCIEVLSNGTRKVCLIDKKGKSVESLYVE